MIGTGQRLDGRAAVRAATGDHPYVRLTTARALGADDEVTGYRFDDTVVWFDTGPHGPAGYAIGDAARAVRFLTAPPGPDGPPGRLRSLHLPDLPEPAPVEFTHIGRWLHLSTTTAPAVRPGEERVVPLGEADHAAIDALLDDALPGSTTRPGDGRVVGWYGIFAGRRLVACGADRSRADAGFLASLAVACDQQGRGLGGTLTAALTRRLLTRYGHAALGVYVDNVGAIRLYQRLGYTDALPRTSLHLR
ncbi:GNAT family N-acetyltransferase [Polymorphospora rubra]|uniref:GNAT family N-acetyltransferase n=1 Tax=Polymorphospora rubra TaxID=338584 RepID=UPI0033D94150